MNTQQTTAGILMVRKKTTRLNALRNRATWFIRSLNSDQRQLPSFVIIGAAKGGTTSLFNYLAQHPDVVPPIRKEIHYFDRNYQRGESWYRMHFPTRKELERTSATALTGEASPYYLSHPLAPQRLQAFLPEAKLIVLLRNPVDRALSNYQHMIRLGIETEPLDKALDLEQQRLAGEYDRLKKEPAYYSYNHHHFAYTTRGIYVRELENWLEHIPRERFLVLQSETFYNDPARTFEETSRFIGLSSWQPKAFKTFNSGGDYAPIPAELRSRLEHFFEPYNRELTHLLGTGFDWNRATAPSNPLRG